MKKVFLALLLISLANDYLNAQTQIATTEFGRKVILNTDGTWKYAEEATTSDGRKIILNADGTWKYAEVKKDSGMTLGNKGDPRGSVDSKVRGVGGGDGDKGISYDLGGRGFQKLPPPKYDYQGEGKVVVAILVDRTGKVTKATTGAKGSNTLDEYLLNVAKEAAIKATFDPKPDAPVVQEGTITYSFKLK